MARDDGSVLAWPTRLERSIAVRYLKSRRSRRLASLNTVISIGGVVVGVMALIVVLGTLTTAAQEPQQQQQQQQTAPQTPKAQTPVVERYVVGRALPPEVPGSPVVDMTLEQAINIALEKNLNLQSAKLNPTLQDLQLASTRATFNPRITGTYSFGDTRSISERAEEGVFRNLEVAAQPAERLLVRQAVALQVEGELLAMDAGLAADVVDRAALLAQPAQIGCEDVADEHGSSLCPPGMILQRLPNRASPPAGAAGLRSCSPPRLDGRLNLDGAVYWGGENDLGNGTAIRRARLGVKSQLYRDWYAEIDVDFANNELEIKDAWAGYTGFDNTILKFGQYKEPFSLETVRATTLRLDVPSWPGHRAGQHVDVRLTAEDGYQAQRSYSIASPPG